LAFYALAHASKFVPPGSFRIESNLLPTLSDVAFETPNGRIVLIVANRAGADESFDIRYQGKYLNSTLKVGSVGTYVW
jgi:glucosylceramidase